MTASGCVSYTFAVETPFDLTEVGPTLREEGAARGLDVYYSTAPKPKRFLRLRTTDYTFEVIGPGTEAIPFATDAQNSIRDYLNECRDLYLGLASK